MTAHEHQRHDESIEGSSDRSFGFVFAAVFLIIGLWPLWHHQPVRSWALVIAALFALVAVVRPSLLASLNNWWMKLGLLLGAIVAPIMLTVLFAIAFVPMGWLMRAMGKDPLRLKLDPNAKSYWIDREPPGPPPGSMTNQF